MVCNNNIAAYILQGKETKGVLADFTIGWNDLRN